MCEFFSCVSDGKGKIMYFDWELRKKILNEELDYGPDSHTSIADYFGYKGKKEDKLNKYEYNPLTKKFTIDQLNTKDDSKQVETFCNKLDFKTIIAPLIIKPIVNPLLGKPKKVTEKEIELLKQWASVWDSVRDSVRDSIWDSVRDSVGDSVWDSVGASVGAYYSTFFDIQYNHDLSSCAELWNSGFVPSFDGKKWRLHSGKYAKIVYEMNG